MSAASAEALRLHGVSKHYGHGARTVKALDGVDLAVPRGQLFGLIGHNGAGKSTLFKLLLGLIAPSAGRLEIGGVDIQRGGFREVRRTLGYLPENLVLYDNLSGLETLQFFARLKGAPKSQCEPLLRQVGLGSAAQRAVREYSKGMRQRLGFAQALLGSPRLLLLDEPTTGLDPQATRDFYAQLGRLRDDGVTLMISSHVLAELQERVDAIAILANGRLAAQGTVQALRERSRMPLRLRLRAAPPRLDALPQQLAANAALPAAALAAGFERLDAQHAQLECPRELKMALLAALAQAGLDDLAIHEASLEDVYFDLREASA